MISREDMIEQSVHDYLREQIAERGYPEDQVEFVENFELARIRQGLTKNVITVGFNFDDGGEQAELGSALTTRIYTMEFFVFGMTSTYGRNLANVVKFALERDGRIPLKDISDADQPVIDYLIPLVPRAARQPIADPEPWQENVWLTSVQIEDVYDASLV